MPKQTRLPTRSTHRKPEPKRTAPARSRKASSRGSMKLSRPKRPAFQGFDSLSLDRKLDILGVFLALVGLLTFFSLVSPSNGALTGWWVDLVRQVAGRGAFILPFALIGVGVWLVLRNVERLPMLSAERLTGVTLLALNLLAWMHLLTGAQWGTDSVKLGGGYIGAAMAIPLISALGSAGAVVALIAWFLVSFALALDASISEIFAFIQNGLASLARRARTQVGGRAPSAARAGLSHDIQNLSAPQAPMPPPSEAITGGFKPLRAPTAQPAMTLAGEPAQAGVDSAAGQKAPRAARPTGVQGAAQPEKKPAHPAIPWKLPNIKEILEPGTVDVIKSNQDAERSKLIEDTLNSFGTPVRVVEVHRGPTVTQFGVEPLYIETRAGRTRVRVSKIVALADDLALALAAPRIRIQAPVPGRNYVGIEVPNVEISRVMLRDVIESDAFQRLRSPLRFALGKDVSGHPKAYDLATMPHLLIAGTTGSGKSVLVNAILTAFLLSNTPAELKMILVDPKRVELTGYNGIPHLLAPVVVEAEQVIGALQWVQREMDARYHLFQQVGARNIVDYNSKNAPALPYMLVLVDELADLMMLAPDETERSLTRLAQLARATGIHLVLATQRPSVDVVTGLIKANFPARVAFAVASGTDSRVILDQPGAERLLGRGDMLFQAPDAAAPLRVQGVFVSDPEIHSLVEYWRTQAFEMRSLNLSTTTATPVNMDMPLNAPLKQTPLFGDEENNGKPGDPLITEATNIVRQEGKASISMLQRKLRIGYTRSARLIDALESQGIIGPAQPTSQVREVLDMGAEKDSEVENSLEDEEPEE